SAVVASMQSLPRPALQILETCTALGAGADLPRVTALLDKQDAGNDSHHEKVWQWLTTLAVYGLAWPVDEHIVINPGVASVILRPLALGPPLEAQLQDLNVDGLVGAVCNWGIEVPKRRAELVRTIVSLYSEPARVRQLL